MGGEISVGGKFKLWSGGGKGKGNVVGGDEYERDDGIVGGTVWTLWFERFLQLIGRESQLLS